MNQLETLRRYTTVVADTGDVQLIGRHRPRDATTNPSLIWKAAQKPESAALVQGVAQRHHGRPIDEVVDRLLVRLGCDILQLIPGRVSTEVDARLSFDALATQKRAERIIDLYRAEGIDPERILIKIASTWEGMQAARRLEAQGIHTNLTLLFSFWQAVACGQAGVRLISPFVGRIYDWYKKAAGGAWDEAAHAGANDPGVQSVRKIFNYYKKFGIRTEIMGASFRNVGQIAALAGCDLLTISPELLAQLAASQEPLTPALDAHVARELALDRVSELNETEFRFVLNEDAMATEKLAEGIRLFVADTLRLENQLQILG